MSFNIRADFSAAAAFVAVTLAARMVRFFDRHRAERQVAASIKVCAALADDLRSEQRDIVGGCEAQLPVGVLHIEAGSALDVGPGEAPAADGFRIVGNAGNGEILSGQQVE